MNEEELNFKYARVRENGAILLGRNVVADGFDRRLVRVVTHAHRDHTKALASSNKTSIYIIATPITFEFLKLLGYRISEDKKLPLKYGKPVTIEEETIRLERARHIAGSAQVVVESRNYRVGYTGDFKMPGTKPLKDLDALVIDATYGSPRYQRRWSDWEALDALISLIDDKIRYGPVWIYGFNGKLQEIMIELRRRGIEYPFLAEPLAFEMAKISSTEYGVPLGDIRPYTGGIVDESALVFIHESKRNGKMRLPGVHVRLTGWEVKSMIRQISPTYYNVSFSDHATFREIIEYVAEANPKIVIVDAYRGRDSWYTARYIERRLGIRATYMPVRSH